MAEMKSNRNDEWVQLTPNIAFQSKIDTKSSSKDQKVISQAQKMAIERMLRSQGYTAPVSTSPYYVGVKDMNQNWKSEQLAWHLLGFYIDCNATATDDGEREDHPHRRLDTDNTICKRKVMYAVYVDPYYQEGGLGEYTYYDRSAREYTCHNGGSCRAKMDCHSADSETWQLVGIFTIDRLSERDGWMEQLFKHAGVCYWGWDNYTIASSMRETLPRQCKKTDFKIFGGKTLYADLKPTPSAGLSMGLYTDKRCSQLYENANGTNYDPFSVIGTTESDFDSFNSLLDGYKICQPCIAYNLTDYDFTCSDDADYRNCNQCMKFAIKAESYIAAPHDIRRAYMQQSMLPLADIGNYTVAAPVLQADDCPFYLKASIYFFVGCFVLFLQPFFCGRSQYKKLPKLCRKGADATPDKTDRLDSPLSPSTVVIDDFNAPSKSIKKSISEDDSKLSPPKIIRDSSGKFFQLPR